MEADFSPGILLQTLAITCSRLAHTNVFHSPLRPITYPENRTQRAYQLFRTGHYIIKHHINPWKPLGITNTSTNDSSLRLPGQAILEPAVDDESATKSEPAEQMDFPLVSSAMAYDGINKLDMARIMPMIAALPLFEKVVTALEEQDQRDPPQAADKYRSAMLLASSNLIPAVCLRGCWLKR